MAWSGKARLGMARHGKVCEARPGYAWQGLTGFSKNLGHSLHLSSTTLNEPKDISQTFFRSLLRLFRKLLSHSSFPRKEDGYDIPNSSLYHGGSLAAVMKEE